MENEDRANRNKSINKKEKLKKITEMNGEKKTDT